MSSYDDYLRDLRHICISQHFQLTEYALSSGYIFPIVDIFPESPNSTTFLVLAGLHGDEQAPISAVSEFLRGYDYETYPNTRIILFPCMNPFGFSRNIRRNADGIDPNRIYRMKPLSEEQALLFQSIDGLPLSAVLSLHEDSATHKSYLYAYDRQYDDLYRKIQVSVGQYMTLDDSDSICGHPADEGIVYGHRDRSLEYLFSRRTPLVVCSETGSREAWERRVQANLSAIRTFVVSSMLGSYREGRDIYHIPSLTQ